MHGILKRTSAKNVINWLRSPANDNWISEAQNRLYEIQCRRIQGTTSFLIPRVSNEVVMFLYRWENGKMWECKKLCRAKHVKPLESGRGMFLAKGELEIYPSSPQWGRNNFARGKFIRFLSCLSAYWRTKEAAARETVLQRRKNIVDRARERERTFRRKDLLSQAIFTRM